MTHRVPFPLLQTADADGAAPGDGDAAAQDPRAAGEHDGHGRDHDGRGPDHAARVLPHGGGAGAGAAAGRGRQQGGLRQGGSDGECVQPMLVTLPMAMYAPLVVFSGGVEIWGCSKEVLTSALALAQPITKFTLVILVGCAVPERDLLVPSSTVDFRFTGQSNMHK